MLDKTCRLTSDVQVQQTRSACRLRKAKTVAKAMNLKLDMDSPADRENLRRVVLELVAERKGRKQKRRD